MKYVFVLNSFSKKFSKDLYRKIQVVAQNSNLDYVIEVNSANLSTEDVLKKYKKARNIIVAVGGDGMINKVVNGIIDTSNMLSYIPYGTCNDFAKTVKETLDQGRNCIDAVRINDRYFINAAYFRLYDDTANEEKFVHNKFNLKSPRYKAKRITIDDEMINQEFSTVVICNARYFDGKYKIGLDSILNDGLIEVYSVKKLNKIDMAKVMMSIKNGTHLNNSKIERIKVERLFIQSDMPISGNIDGEILTAKNFDIEVLPKEIELFNNQELIEKVLKK